MAPSVTLVVPKATTRPKKRAPDQEATVIRYICSRCKRKHRKPIAASACSCSWVQDPLESHGRYVRVRFFGHTIKRTEIRLKREALVVQYYCTECEKVYRARCTDARRYYNRRPTEKTSECCTNHSNTPSHFKRVTFLPGEWCEFAGHDQQYTLQNQRQSTYYDSGSQLCSRAGEGAGYKTRYHYEYLVRCRRCGNQYTKTQDYPHHD